MEKRQKFSVGCWIRIWILPVCTQRPKLKKNIYGSTNTVNICLILQYVWRRPVIAELSATKFGLKWQWKHILTIFCNLIRNILAKCKHRIETYETLRMETIILDNIIEIMNHFKFLATMHQERVKKSLLRVNQHIKRILIGDVFYDVAASLL